MVAEKILLGVFFPLIGSLLIGFFGRFFGKRGCSFLAVVSLGFSLYFFISQGLKLAWTGSTKLIFVFPWVFSSVNWAFLFDQLSLEMCVLIASITFCVILYSTEYMYHDPHLLRFLSLLSLFAFFMIILVTGSSFLQVFVGWEGVGFVSFLLINFWFTRLEANRSAIKAMLFNRIGDSFYLVGLAFFFILFKTTDVLVLNHISSFVDSNSYFSFNFCGYYLNSMDIILLSFFLAAVGKSAQLGLHAWLPDAMEGPTPVSSLLHSATMVTAGVFLLIRLSPLFNFCTILPVLIFISAFTAFVNAFFGFFQNDLKKIIAFSTCSQLGMMIVAVFYNANLGFYHLVNHGFFKALLFLSAGSVIHAVSNEQDIRKLKGLYHFMPFTSLCMLIGNLALVGFPFLSGFYSKEFILFNTFSTGLIFDQIIFVMLILTSMFTALYSIKIMQAVFFDIICSHPRSSLKLVHEPKPSMLIPMFLLGFFAIVFGFFNEELFFSIGSSKWETVLGFFSAAQKNITYVFFDTEISSFGLKWFLIYFSVYFSYRILKQELGNPGFGFFLKENRSKLLLFFLWAFANKLGFISLYRSLSTFFFKTNYRAIFLLLDRGLFEIVGPTQIVRIFSKTRFLHTNTLVTLFNLFIYLVFFMFLFSFLFYVKFSLLLFLLFLFFVFYQCV